MQGSITTFIKLPHHHHTKGKLHPMTKFVGCAFHLPLSLHHQSVGEQPNWMLHKVAFHHPTGWINRHNPPKVTENWWKKGFNSEPKEMKIPGLNFMGVGHNPWKNTQIALVSPTLSFWNVWVPHKEVCWQTLCWGLHRWLQLQWWLLSASFRLESC